MIIRHNLLASNTKRQLGILTDEQTKIGENLSSGYRINRASDDAAGLCISEKMRSLIRGLNQSSRNAQDGISLIQTAEGALNEVHSMLQRIREMSVQASNDTNTTNDRDAIQKEIGELVKHVDNISSETMFNGIKLLDGTLGNQSTSPIESISSLNGTATKNSMSLQELLSNKSNNLNIIYMEETNDYATTTTGTGSTIAGYSSLKNDLQTQIVPQAVTSIISAYSPAFDYLSSSSVGIGLNLYSDGSSSTLASVSIGYSYYSDNSVVNNMLTYKLSVNMSSLFFDGSGNLTNTSRTDLETTIVHEMVHAIMDESLTNGMIGVTNGYLNAPESFPGWFKEGMAQSAAGGYANCNDWVNSDLGITTSTSTAGISSIVASGSNSLASASDSSCYGTGYLACMYLGYMASGGTSVSAASIGDGLGIILNKLINGSSLNSVINEISVGKYTSTADFQNKFGDTDSSNFIYNLTSVVGNTGNGGLASGNLTDSDLLSNTTISTSLFSLDTTHDTVKNVYPSNVTVFEGGTTATSGTGATTSSSGGTTGSTPGSGGSSPTFSGGLTLQIGAEANQTIIIAIDSIRASNLGIDTLSVLTQSGAEESITASNEAINKVSAIRSNLGAYQNRLEHTISNLNNSAENMQASESRIRDMDMAKGIMKYTKLNVLMNAGQSLLAQANHSADNILALLH